MRSTTPVAAILALALALAVAVAPVACSGSGGGGRFAPGSAVAPPATGSGSGPAPGSPAAPAAPPDVDAEGAIAVHSGPTPCLHWTAAGGAGTTYALTGAEATRLHADLAVADHPVHVTGRFSGAGCAAAPGLEVIGYTFDVYAARPVAPGVTWRTRRFDRLFGSTQTVNVVDVDLRNPGVTVRPVARPAGAGGRVTSRLARDAGAAAAVNGGYFDGSANPTGLLKIEGRLLASNPTSRPPRSAVGFGPNGLVLIERIPGGDPWPAARSALGAGPNLVTAGRPDVTRAAEGMVASLGNRHPRTAVGTRPGGFLVLVAVDGRTAAGAGVTLDELARLLVQLGCDRALNLDGGGSTTMVVRGQPFDGVVNHPSDNGRADHLGERRVANIVAVFSN